MGKANEGRVSVCRDEPGTSPRPHGAMSCAHTDDAFDRCWRRPTVAVEHRDGERLPYCAEHAERWSHRPQLPIPEELTS
jgi:hypothetical protein